MALTRGASLPIFPLAMPCEDKKGVLLVGDYIAQDLINYLQIQPGNRRLNWLILSTTQSDVIPTDCSSVDFNFFTNHSGINKYLFSLAGNVPFSTELGDGHYVDPEVFSPDDNVTKEWDIVYPAKWYPTKQTELLLETARLDPTLKIAIYGWPVVSERKIGLSLAYRDRIVSTARNLPNVTIFDSGFQNYALNHTNKDGSVVIGNLTKEQMRDRFHRKARTSIFLSETTEAINRVCTEMLCCDVPMLVTSTNGGLERLVTPSTGVMIDKNASGILEGVHYVLEHNEQFSSRKSFLAVYGRDNSNKMLRKIIADTARDKGVEINWADMRYYGGDLWTSPEIYQVALKHESN